MATSFEHRREDKRRKRNAYLIGGFMIFLMVSLSLGYIEFADSATPPSAIQDSGMTFIPVAGGGYAVQIGKDRVMFDYLPRDVVSFSHVSLSLAPSRVYLVSDLLDSEYGYQRLAAFLAYKEFFVQPACLAAEGCGDLPVVSCTDTSRQIIILRQQTSSGISVDGSCVVVGFTEAEQIQIISLLIYQLLGVL